MLRVVLPVVAAAPIAAAPVSASSRLIRHAVAAVYVRIAVKVVVIVDCDVVVAAPPATPAPASTPCRSHRQPHTKRYRHTSSVVAGWRVVDWRIRVYRRAIDDSRVVARHIHNLGISLLNDDNLLRFHNFCFDFLLFT
jgi:hypothetical protein